ncbi:tRNA wybutosine-synthesizing protein 3 homolog isoform X2 [Gracilinanus agilis]|uniref:tRNA wybutosine-synthesizing protein 3 homolog isoform X2 n=1 Tax=Gracilinanus agilis TaxID=191870 RepID=UPI001CFC7B61|nr:tRNA wybutosine-synthesizing protein 3 homolog isoform X2 [Gracilinanus agilis]
MEGSGEFQKWKTQGLSKADLSRQGVIDEDVAELVELLNGQEEFFTRSSCAGRILLLDGSTNGCKIQKQNCSWLLVTHQFCAKDDLHSVAIDSGFRNSGITVGKKGKTVLAVRSTHGLEVPLSHKGRLMVTEEYIDFLLKIANQKMEENKKRIERFYSCLQLALKREEASDLHPEAKKTVHCVYTHRRKRKTEKTHGQRRCPEKQEDLESDEDNAEIGLDFFPEDY